VVTKMAARSGDGSRIGRKLREASGSAGHVTLVRESTSRPDGDKMTNTLLRDALGAKQAVDKV